MPRSPPSNYGSPIQHYSSDPNIARSSPLMQETLSFTNIATNSNSRDLKRKHDDITKTEIIDIFTTLRKEQDEKFSAVLSSISEVKASLDCMSIQFDQVLQRVTVLEVEKKASDAKILLLESKVDQLERQIKGTSIEIRNVPQEAKESKFDLKKLICKTAEALNIPLDSTSDIKDIYRVNSKSKTNPIIADFSTVLVRDNFLVSYKKFNKEHPTAKFSSESLGISGPSQPLYISENLTQREKNLFYQARVFAKGNGYAHCWTSYGRTFIRKTNDSPRIRIFDESDLVNLIQ